MKSRADKRGKTVKTTILHEFCGIKQGSGSGGITAGVQLLHNWLIDLSRSQLRPPNFKAKTFGLSLTFVSTLKTVCFVFFKMASFNL